MTGLVDKGVEDNSSTFSQVCKDVGFGRATKNDDSDHFQESGTLWLSHIQVTHKGSD